MVGKWELSSSSWIISDCQWLKGRLLQGTAEIPPNLPPNLPRSEAAKVPLLSPSLQSLPLCLTHSFVCNLQDWICVWMLCRILQGYGGLFSLHCSCYFSNYIDIKLFFLHLLCTGMVQKKKKRKKIFSWLYWTAMLQQFNFLTSRGHWASLCAGLYLITLKCWQIKTKKKKKRRRASAR